MKAYVVEAIGQMQTFFLDPKDAERVCKVSADEGAFVRTINVYESGSYSLPTVYRVHAETTKDPVGASTVYTRSSDKVVRFRDDDRVPVSCNQYRTMDGSYMTVVSGSDLDEVERVVERTADVLEQELANQSLAKNTKESS